MYPFDRWLVRVYGFLIAIGTIWIMLQLLQFSPVVQTNAYLVAQQTGWLWLGLAVILVLSIRYLAFRLLPRKHHAFVKEMEGGHIRIGHQTVKEIAMRAAKQVRGAQRVQIKIDESAQGLVLLVTVFADPVDLNAMGEEIQRTVGNSIREMTSLTIAAVHVSVIDLAPDPVQK